VPLILPAEAFAQPLPLSALVETVLSLPMSSLGPIFPPGSGLGAHATIGQALASRDRNGVEKARISARILEEELPGLLPRAAPIIQTVASELYARTFTVAELDAAAGFYATPAGRALARQTFTPIVDPELVRGFVLMAPRIAAEGVGAMIRVGQATAHLPPPPAAPAPPAPRGPDPDPDPDPDGDDDED
jgi:hypothetical protein